MKKSVVSFVLAMVVLAVALVLGSCAEDQSQAVGDQNQAKPYEQEGWEYTQVWTMDEVNALAKEGWELYTVIPINRENNYYTVPLYVLRRKV